MPPATRAQFPLRWPVNARVKAWVGGKEEIPLPLLLWQWQGTVGISPQGGSNFRPLVQGSIPPNPPLEVQEESLRLGYSKGSRKGWAGEGRGKVVLSISLQMGSRVQICIHHL